MGIKFKPEWAKGLDGAHIIPRNVEEATEKLEVGTGALRPFCGAGRGIDYALAAACDDAKTPLEAFDHLGFIVSQLLNVRENMRREAAEELEAARADDKTLPLGFVDEPIKLSKFPLEREEKQTFIQTNAGAAYYVAGHVEVERADAPPELVGQAGAYAWLEDVGGRSESVYNHGFNFGEVKAGASAAIEDYQDTGETWAGDFDGQRGADRFPD
jgi:hypothetical protein